jgi:spermidine dehydrogenase
MHAVRDGSFWPNAGEPVDTGEAYDLVVVGAGISGLSAAHLYRQQSPGARVLLVDPLEDFGGHAKRNEFTASNGQTLIGYGGSQSLQTPTYFSPAVSALLRDVGVEWEQFEEFYDATWAEDRGLSGAIFFDADQWGEDRLVKRDTETTAEWVARTPLSDRARADLVELIDAPRDYLPGLTPEERLQRLSEITYKEFLLDVVGADPQVADYFQTSTAGYFGVGIDAVTALDARGNWNPGFDGMDLGDAVHPAHSPSGRLAFTDPDPYIYHFPDGNAGVARALVRALIPDALPGTTMEDLVTADVDYGRLDRPENEVRLRLGCTVVNVAHDGDPASATGVTVTYADTGGQPRTVRAGHVVLAAWHRVVPYLTTEIAQDQIDALNDQQKVPLIYANVLLRNWEALAELGIDGARARGNFWSGFEIDFPVSMGAYRFADAPSDPVILHLSKVMVEPGLPSRDQALAGKRAMMALTFEDLELSIRDSSTAPSRAPASTWPRRGGDHRQPLEPRLRLRVHAPLGRLLADGPLPIETARQGGAASPSPAPTRVPTPTSHSAIDQAVRAVRELLGEPPGAPAFSRFPGPPPEALGL